jgi:hypothetical protein
MTKLSPAAQAVEDAVDNALSNSRARAAAALRAVAEPFHWTWNAKMCHKHLITIAQELETQ